MSNPTPTEEAREIAENILTDWIAETKPDGYIPTNNDCKLINPIVSALKARELAGYNRGVEESAKVADTIGEEWRNNCAAQDDRLSRAANDKYHACVDAATEIRKLNKAG
jgi:hypothetical protein